MYGGRSRFITDKVLKCFEQTSYIGSNAGDSRLDSTGSERISIDASGMLREMW